MHHSRMLTFALLTATAPVTAQSSLAARVSQAPDGIVRMQFDSRAGVCGNGRDRISYKHSTFGNNFESYGRWSDDTCLAGPLRVAMTVAGGRVTRAQTQVGGSWNAANRVTDLGTVSSRDASAYLFSLVPVLESSRDRDRVLLPAVLADDALVVPPLMALARDESRALDTRRQSIHWLGVFGDASIVPALVSFARKDANGDDRGERQDLASSAVAALSNMEGGVGITALIDLARHAAVSTRRNAVFWLGQSGDPRALKTLRTVIADRDENTEVRKNAIFSLGQSQESATKDLVDVYRDVSEKALREQAIFALSQRNDETSTDALIGIARDDADKSMRSKAIFWLAQKHDARATKLISDLILR